MFWEEKSHIFQYSKNRLPLLGPKAQTQVYTHIISKNSGYSCLKERKHIMTFLIEEKLIIF
jgi:hypothetical protein